MKLAVDVSERALLAALFYLFCARIGWDQLFDPINFGVVVIEILGIWFIFTRRPGDVIPEPYALAIALLGTAFPLLATPGGVPIAPRWAGEAFMLVGLPLSIAGLLSLNRSFGLVAANRGVKRGGPYKLIRHPIYAGYILAHLGFLSQHFSRWNLVIYALGWSLLLLRILAEERFLNRDEAYREYAGGVRYRLAPGVF